MSVNNVFWGDLVKERLNQQNSIANTIFLNMQCYKYFRGEKMIIKLFAYKNSKNC